MKKLICFLFILFFLFCHINFSAAATAAGNVMKNGQKEAYDRVKRGQKNYTK